MVKIGSNLGSLRVLKVPPGSGPKPHILAPAKVWAQEGSKWGQNRVKWHFHIWPLIGKMTKLSFFANREKWSNSQNFGVLFWHGFWGSEQVLQPKGSLAWALPTPLRTLVKMVETNAKKGPSRVLKRSPKWAKIGTFGRRGSASGGLKMGSKCLGQNGILDWPLIGQMTKIDNFFNRKVVQIGQNLGSRAWVWGFDPQPKRQL